MASKHLTDTQIKTEKPRDKEFSLSDGQGLYLRITPKGRKFWLFNYTRPNTTKRTNLGVGGYPAVSLADARKHRQSYRALLANGIDPKAHKDSQAQASAKALSNTFGVVAAKWFKVKKTAIKSRTAHTVWRSLEMHVLPDLENTPIDQIKAPNVIAILKRVESAGNLDTVSRLCQRVNEVMTYAVNYGLVHHNPLEGISAVFQNPTTTKQPTLLPAELPRFMRALAMARSRLITRAAIEFQLHTMARPGEAAGAMWDEIDFDNQLWVIPAERMKSKRVHEIPLTPQALALLETIKPISGHRKYLFTGASDLNTHIHTSTLNEAIRNMGFKGELVAHGLRALASTILNEQRFDNDLIEAAFSHIDPNKVRAAYKRTTYLEQRRSLMCWWSDHIEKAATGNMSLASNVINIRAA